MERSISKILTLSCNGLLYKIYHGIRDGEEHILKIVPFKFNSDEALFSKGSFHSPIIAQGAVCYSAKSCIDLFSGVTNCMIVLRNLIDHSFNFYKVENNNLELLGNLPAHLLDRSFSNCGNIIEDANVPSSQICTQIFSTIRTQTQYQSENLNPERQQYSLFILDGPCVCVIFNNKICLSRIDAGKPICLVRYELPKILSSFCVLWIGTCQEHVLLLGTVDAKDNLSSKPLRENHVNVCCHNKHGNSAINHRKLISLKISFVLNHDTPQQTQTVENDIDVIPSTDFIPNIYSDVIVCANVKNCYEEEVVVQNFSVKKSSTLYRNETFICTRLKQVLHFQNGRVKNCVNIPSDCATEIKEFETFTGKAFISIWTIDKKIILIDKECFQVVQVISDVESFAIDDFVSNGADQLLMTLSAQDQPEETDTGTMGRYILTDCQGLLIQSDNSQCDPNVKGDDCAESLQSAIQALQTRQQVAYQSLYEAEKLARSKQELINETCSTLSTLCLETHTDLQPHCYHNLVPLISVGGKKVPRAPPKPKLLPTAARLTIARAEPASQTLTPSASETCTQTIPATFTQTVPATCTVPGPSGQGSATVAVLDSWFRLMAPGSFIVGVKILNQMHRPMTDIHMSLVEVGAAFPQKKAVTYQSGAFSISTSTSITSAIYSEPPEKRSKLQPHLVNVLGQETLPANSSCHVLAQSTIPTFDYSSSKLYNILLFWRWVSVEGGCMKQVGVCTGSDDTEYRVHTQLCGTVTLTVYDICHTGVSWINISELLEPDADLRLLLCLELIQDTKTIQLSSLFSSLAQHLHKALNNLGFGATSQGFHICTSPGQLQWVRVQLQQHGKHTVYMHTSTRSNSQLILLTHALYTKLPDDIIIETCNQEQITSSVNKTIHCLCTELVSTESQLRQLLASGSSTQMNQDMCSGDQGSARTAFQHQRDAMSRREQASIDQNQLDKFMDKRRVLRTRTDDAVRSLAHLINR